MSSSPKSNYHVLPLPVAIPCGWQALKIQEMTAPGDWEWSAASQQWVPVLVRAWVCYGETRIRRMSFRNGEKVRVFREGDGLPFGLPLEVHTILSSDAYGKQLLRCLAGTLVSIHSDLLQPVYDLGTDPGRPLERWKLEDVVREMHPQDNPNFVQNPTPQPEPVIKDLLTTEPEPANCPETQPWTPGLGDEVIVTRRVDALRGTVGTVQQKNGSLFKVWFPHKLVEAWFPAHELRPRRSNNPEILDSLLDIGELERCEANEKITIGYTVPNAYDSDAEPITEPIQRKRVLYIAGPMRGIAWFNYPMFDRVAKELRDAGNEVISPADEDRKHDGFDPFANPSHANPDACTFPKTMDFAKTVRRCLDAVLRCDEIVLLPGWENSNGAVAELTLAMWLGKRVRDVRIDDQDRITYLGQWMGLAGLAMQLSDYHLEVEVPIVVDDEDDDEDILAEASRITRGSRQSQYGPPDQDFRRTAGMWSALFISKLKDGVTFESRDVALAMILLKTSRETHQRKRDNWVDIAGYASCGSRCN